MKQSHIRDSERTKANILNAAETEFAEKGLYGARIDVIAEKANINKRMIYAYFESKENLYKSVLVTVYSRLTKKEINVLSEDISCKEAIRRVIELYFDFLSNNPTYVSLILWENLNKGQYIQDIDFKEIKDPAFELLRKVIVRGKKEGIFHENIDSEEIILSLLTCTFAYFSNRYTLSKLLKKQIDEEANIKSRVNSVVDMFLNYMCVKD